MPPLLPTNPKVSLGWLLISVLKAVAFSVARFLHNQLQWLLWCFFHGNVSKSEVNKGSLSRKKDDGCFAEVFNVVSRYKLDPVQKSSLDDFILTREDLSIPTSSLFNYAVGLYQITAEEAVFVEMGETTSQDSGQNAVLMQRQVQFHNASKIIKVPLMSLTDLLDEAKIDDCDRPQEIIFVYNAACCGTSRLTQVLGALDAVMTVKQPDALVSLLTLMNTGTICDVNTRQKRVQNLIRRVICKPQINWQNPDHAERQIFVIEMPSTAIDHALFLSECLPDSHQYMFYDSCSNLCHSYKLATKDSSLLQMGLKFGKTSDTLKRYLLQQLGLEDVCANLDDWTGDPGELGMMMYAYAVNRYSQMERRNGNLIRAIRSDDFNANLKMTIQKILDSCSKCSVYDYMNTIDEVYHSMCLMSPSWEQIKEETKKENRLEICWTEQEEQLLQKLSEFYNITPEPYTTLKNTINVVDILDTADEMDHSLKPVTEDTNNQTLNYVKDKTDTNQQQETFDATAHIHPKNIFQTFTAGPVKQTILTTNQTTETQHKSADESAVEESDNTSTSSFDFIKKSSSADSVHSESYRQALYLHPMAPKYIKLG